jgi:hypothetical protein
MRSVATTARSAIGLDFIERACVCSVVFALVAFNGRPARLSSGFVCLLIAAALLAHGLIKRNGELGVPRRALTTMLVLGAWVFTATLSTVANSSAEAYLNLLFGYWTPFFLFLMLAGLRPSPRDFAWIFVSLAGAVLIRFTLASAIFLRDWGFLSLDALIMAHFNVPRMGPYMDVTFGSTSSTAALIVALMPILLLAPLVTRLGTASRLIVTAASVVLGLNALITGSRGALLVIVAVGCFAAFRLRSKWRFALLIALAAGAAAFAATAGEAILRRFTSAATFDTLGDNSVRERFASIEYGLGMMADHPLGVGPGLSHYYNPYDVAHQFAVAQGSEIGWAGAVVVAVLTALIIAGALARGSGRGEGPEFAFRIGALSWIVYGMTTNIPLNSTATVAWVGLLVVCLAFGLAPPQHLGRGPKRHPSERWSSPGGGRFEQAQAAMVARSTRLR